MIWTRFRRQPRRDTIAALYGTIVAQARCPVFYRDFAVPDTVNGRFDLLVLHVALVLNRLTRPDGGDAGLAQELFDMFCSDMDGNLREMGIGDLKVPKEMQSLAEAFYGRARTYDAALAQADDAALADALNRNIYAQAGSAGQAEVLRLAAYARETVRALQAWTPDASGRTGLEFPDPAILATGRKAT